MSDPNDEQVRLLKEATDVSTPEQLAARIANFCGSTERGYWEILGVFDSDFLVEAFRVGVANGTLRRRITPEDVLLFSAGFPGVDIDRVHLKERA
jgi:hypothetical protein